MTHLSDKSEVISARREDVLQSYKSAIATNYRLFKEGDDTATSEIHLPKSHGRCIQYRKYVLSEKMPCYQYSKKDKSWRRWSYD